MDIDKKMEMLRKRNALLQEENEHLKSQISKQSDDKNRYAALCEQLETLKDRWKKEIDALTALKIKYESMIVDVKKVKDILVGK